MILDEEYCVIPLLTITCFRTRACFKNAPANNISFWNPWKLWIFIDSRLSSKQRGTLFNVIDDSYQPQLRLNFSCNPCREFSQRCKDNISNNPHKVPNDANCRTCLSWILIVHLLPDWWLSIPNMTRDVETWIMNLSKVREIEDNYIPLLNASTCRR